MNANSMVKTDVPGLDEILGGGLSQGNIFLLEGNPGTGKTTIALRFLLHGATAGEGGLYITMSETEAELRAGAASHGWEIPPSIEVYELTPPESRAQLGQEQSLLYSSDLELGETIQLMLERVEANKPARIVIDSLSEIRLLAQSSLRYRRQVLALKHYFSGAGATVLLLDDLTSDEHDKTVHSVVHGVIKLEEIPREYGAERRRLRVIKYRGQRFRGGFHDFLIRTGGVEVFPRLVAADQRAAVELEQIGSGLEPLDKLLGGGIERGSSTLILGPAGTGKSTITLQFISAAVERGERCALFIFDEEQGLLTKRSLALGFDLEKWQKAGLLEIVQVDAAEWSPGEFAQRVRNCAKDPLSIVVIDSLNGYRAAMPDELSLTLHIHELLQYLNRLGVATFLTVSQHGLVGDIDAPVELTYLADTVVLLRYFEAVGSIRRAISVVKKRTSRHELTIREYSISAGGVALGNPITEFSGVLSGKPVLVEASSSLLGDAKTATER